VRTSDFDYDLPDSYIAQKPVEPRDSARLLVVDRATGTFVHRIFRDIGDYLVPGDVLVANESRVFPARLWARKVPDGGRVELLLLARRDGQTWEALVRGRKTPVGTRLILSRRGLAAPTSRDACTCSDLDGSAVQGEVSAWTESGGRLIRWDRPIDGHLAEYGVIPLPPYIHLPLADPERYQTVYARQPGSVAAPTAGLHFTPELMLSLRQQGVQFTFVNLEIGLDTFRPVQTEDIQDHRIHTERCSLSPETAKQINQAKLEGRRVIAVGTTSIRVIETAARQALGGPQEVQGPRQVVRSFSGSTDLFICPGFQFQVTEALITNFHLPRSSLLLLVSALAGRDLVLSAYQEAIREGYRFFSFGDSMLIL
jgi:S-adenosylmethionine:tRNA ribosyltransferase-isomerase